MRLAFQIPHRLYWIHNFLNDEQYKRIHNAAHKEKKKHGYLKASKLWEGQLLSNIRSPDRSPIDPIFFSFYETLLRHNPIFPIQGSINYTVHRWNYGTGINWHTDGKHKIGLTYFLNRRWNSQWGGEFMFKTDSTCGYLPVVGNSVVIVQFPCLHKVNPILSPIVPRLTIQSFVH